MKKSLLHAIAVPVLFGGLLPGMCRTTRADDLKQAEPQVMRDVDYLLADRAEKADIYLPPDEPRMSSHLRC